MSGKNGDPSKQLRERIRFFMEIGADFARIPEDPGRSSGAGTKLPEIRPAAGSEPRSTAASSGEQAPSPGEPEFIGRILACRRCPLAETRNRAVPGEGNLQAELMFVGEGPGRDEDIQGRPFVGRAGQLLTRIIRAMTFERSQVYITNMVKCRPPDNRDPLPDEVESCRPYLLEQIEFIRPKVIVTLGRVAAGFFIPHVDRMGAVRGKFHLWEGIPVMPTFHPSYLVRNEGNRDLKRKVWEDMKQVMARLDRRP